MHQVIGVDLGTTYSAVAGWDPARLDAFIIADKTVVDGRMTPSVVSFRPTLGRVIAGHHARQSLPNYPDNTIIEAKRAIGAVFSTRTLAQYGAEHVFSVGDPVRVHFGGEWRLPQEIVAFLLLKMRGIAEAEIGDKVIDAVISVPAYFTGKQRKATEEAALLAGLYPRQLIAEPTAAAICYGLDQYEEERKVYLVYDLGGGTFDVSIIVVENNDIQIVATHGDPRLGGADFDAAIMEWAVEELAQKHQLDIRNDQRSKEIVKFQAEALKIDLSTFESADMTMPELRPENPPTLTLERKRFQELIAEILEKSLNYTNIATDIAEREKGVPRDQIDAILLVGGSSKIPYVKERLLEHFGRDESFVRGDLDPDAVVARGAAIVAKRYKASESFDVLREIGTTQTAVDDDDPIIHHITEHSLGVRVQDDRITKIITRGTTIPVSASLCLVTPDAATELSVEIYQGESDHVRDCTKIGTLTIGPTEPRPRGEHDLEITFRLDGNGQLSTTVLRFNDNRRYSATFRRDSSIGDLQSLYGRTAELYYGEPYTNPGAAQKDQAASGADLGSYSYLLSAFFPDRIALEDTAELRATVFLESVIPNDVVREASKAIHLPRDAALRASVSEPLYVPKETLLWVTPEIRGLRFDTRGKYLALWEDTQSVSFRFRADRSVAGQLVDGFVHFWLNGVILGSVSIKTYVVSDDAPESFRVELARANAKPYRRVFPSYSHRDKVVVDRMAGYARALGDDYLRDVDALRAGENWSEEIEGFIQSADVFQLFWSSNAAASQFVRKEWTAGLHEAQRRNAATFIRPVYWTSELTPKPPGELGSRIHFTRIELES